MSRPYAEVIGDPISHSKSPLIHNFWLGKLGIDAEYRACHVRPEELDGYLAERREDGAWRGCNVTIPHKESLAALVTSADERAATIGAINTVIPQDGGLFGMNTDFDGIGDALGAIDLAGREVVVLGAGGAARAAFAVLAARRCGEVRVLARSPDKARRIASETGLGISAAPFVETSAEALEGAALLINATQLGMSGQPSMPRFILTGIGTMARHALVFDMVYVPLETELLRAARMSGHNIADGLVMLVGQAATAFEKFFGQAAPRQYDAELRTLLTA